MTLLDLFRTVPAAIDEMEREFFRVSNVHIDRDNYSQESACLMLAIRGTSILTTMGNALKIDSFDVFDVLQRAFMETRELVSTFRFDKDETRKRVSIWFKDKDKDAWKPDFGACERFLQSVGAADLQLARRWGMFSALSHPTHFATSNSVAVRGAVHFPAKRPDLVPILHEKIADYITAVVSLFITASFELKGWIPLGCDSKHMEAAEQLRILAPPIVQPILAGVEANERARAKSRR